jgi:hypothetical protein
MSSTPRSVHFGRPLAVSLLALLLSGCTANRAGGSDSSATVSGAVLSEDNWIAMEVGPCFGTCPVYALRIGGDGVVQYEGIRFVARMGSVMDRIPRDSVRALFATFDSARFSEMADKYVYGEAACGRYATDLPTVITSRGRGSTVKRVEHDRGCSGAPAALTQIESRINLVVRVSRWIGDGVRDGTAAGAPRAPAVRWFRVDAANPEVFPLSTRSEEVSG